MQRTLKFRPARVAGVAELVRRIGRSEVMLGAVVVFVLLVVLVATAIFYVHPTGRKSISFETTDTASIRGGEDVRVAGVSVGKVTKISLEPTTVRVDAEVADDTFVGADSQVEVRMLTPVGGYYVALLPFGSSPLGSDVIPVGRVQIPYSIADVLQAAPHVTDNVNGSTVEANLEQVAEGLKHNSASVGSLIAGLDTIATIMDRQRDQVNTTLDLASEYMRTFNGSRDVVFQLVQKIAIVQATYYTYRDGFNQTYELLGDALIRIGPLEKFYLGHKEQLLTAVNQARAAIKNFQDAIDPVLGQLNGFRSQLGSWLTPQGIQTLSGGTILASGICIPIPGRTC